MIMLYEYPKRMLHARHRVSVFRHVCLPDLIVDSQFILSFFSYFSSLSFPKATSGNLCDDVFLIADIAYEEELPWRLR